MKEIDILKTQLDRAKSLTYNDRNTLDDIVRKGKMSLENIFPTKMYSIEIEQIKFDKHYIVSMPESAYRKDWENGKNQLINLIDTAIQDYDLKKQQANDRPKEIIRERIVQVKDETAINELKDDFRNYKIAVKNWSLFISISLIISAIIWLYYFNSDWPWYNDHDKKTGITLLLNLTIIIALLNIPLQNKWLIWIPIVFGALTTLFTLI